MTHCLVNIEVHQRKSEMSDSVSEESSMFGESNVWWPFLNLFNHFELDDLAREMCDELSGFRTSATCMQLASLDECASTSTSSGLCRNTVSLTLPETSLCSCV